MLVSDLPTRIPTKWADGATSSYVRDIPIPSQSGGAASFTDGFPPVNFLNIASGGVPPDGKDMNGILRLITQWIRWTNAGGPMFYDASFASAVGGYPKGAMLMSTVTNGLLWLCTADNNATDPDGGSPSNWVQILGDASETAKGVAPFATAAEVLAGAVTTKNTTPKALKDAFVGVQSNNGSVPLPGGLILKFGYVATTTAPVTVTFSTAFPNNIFTVVPVKQITTKADASPGIFGTPTTSGFTITMNAAALTGFFWIAIGN